MEDKQKALKRDIIADELRADITTGRLPAGAPLPSIDELRKKHGTTIATVQAAVQTLRREGHVEGGGQGRRPRVARQRTIITRSASYAESQPDGSRRTWKSEMADLGMTGAQQLGRVGETPAPDEVADLLGVDVGEPVLVRPRTMLADDEPVQLADTYYPLDIASGTPLAQQRAVKASLMGEILAKAGLAVEYCEEDLTFPVSDDRQRKALNLGPDGRIVRMVRTTYATGGRPVSVDVMTLRADRHRLCYRMPVQG